MTGRPRLLRPQHTAWAFSAKPTPRLNALPVDHDERMRIGMENQVIARSHKGRGMPVNNAHAQEIQT